MQKIECWPPPDWTEVVVLWEDMLNTSFFHGRARYILQWVDLAPGGEYHLYGYNQTDGFAFRFRNPHDATFFKLSCL